MILNFKKKMDRQGRPEWKYKGRAIADAAAAFRAALNLNNPATRQLTFVPAPPSKAKDDALYDDRLVQMLNAITSNPPLNVRELVVQTQSTDPVHDCDVRPSPDQIEALYQIDEAHSEPTPAEIAVVDDVLTTGAHFRAMSSILVRRFPEVRIVGLFLARRVPETTDIEDLIDLDI